MFEGIVLIIVLIIGGLAALLALFFFILSGIRRSKTMLTTGLIIVIVPLLLSALAYWYYDVHIPGLIKQEERLYTGTYIMTARGTSDSSGVGYGKQIKITLNGDNSFQLDINDFTSFNGKGTWKAGATDDGQFEFRDARDSIVFLAMPSNNNMLEINKNFKDRPGIIFIK
jgi:hypothetical protein